MKKRYKLNHRRREAITGFLFISPWILGFLMFMMYPIYFSLKMSFSKVYITTNGVDTQPIGFDNYKYAFLSDPDFVEKLLNFIKFTVIAVPIIVIFALFVALLINQPIRFRGVFRAIFFLPVVITSGEVMNELFSQGAASLPMLNKYGIINFIRMSLSPAWAGPIINIMQQFILILWYSGVQILIFLAGLQKVNKQTFEAAAIDGASPWEMFWKIILPVVKPFILINIIYSIIDIFVYTSNDVIIMIKDNMFKVATGYGYASALAWIYFSIIFVILIIVLLIFSRKEEYFKIEKNG
ncbi:carbohydrate ABC transporter permease [Caldicellulosiruptoraceae bacterium PP1]